MLPDSLTTPRRRLTDPAASATLNWRPKCIKNPVDWSLLAVEKGDFMKEALERRLVERRNSVLFSTSQGQTVLSSQGIRIKSFTVKDLNHVAAMCGGVSQEGFGAAKRRLQKPLNPDAKAKGDTSVMGDKTLQPLSKSRHKGKLATSHGSRLEDVSTIQETVLYSKVRITANGWATNKNGVASNQGSLYNIGRLKYKDRAISQLPVKDVKVANHILDGEEFLRMLQETKDKKESHGDQKQQSRLTQLVHQSYLRRTQQSNR